MALTENQKKAVKHSEGNVLINAGAGSGKTTAFTARIMYLIKECGVDPTEILAITFTNEAVDNMRSKLSDIIGSRRAKLVNITTFHSLAYKTLKQKYSREYANKKIMPSWWKTSKLYELIKEESYSNPLGLNLKNKNGEINAGDLAQFISYQKANMIKAESAVLIDDELHSSIAECGRFKLQQAYDIYCQQVKFSKQIEFDDMTMDFYFKLVEDEKLLKYMKDSYKIVMVDEFQDTNTVNMEILKLISDNNLYTVGDFRQGIYGFINANIDNILTFQDEFDDVQLIEFRENFRSTKKIVDFCNKIIDVAPVDKYKQFKSQVAARGIDGDVIDIEYFQTEDDELSDIVNKIEDDYNGGVNISDHAIICRTNSQLGQFEITLSDRDIPFDASSSRSFFDRAEIIDLVSYLEHIENEDDDMSIRRIINRPSRYVSNKVINELNEFAFNNKISIESAIGKYSAGRSQSALYSLKEMFEEIREDEDATPLKVLKKIINTTNYEMFIKTKSTTSMDYVTKMEAIDRLIHMSRKFTNIKSFLAHINKVKMNNSKKNKDGIKLMTVHSSKGLEFDKVYGSGIHDDSFPHDMNPDYEEERRLFYVLCSRAKNKLKLSSHVFKTESQETIRPCPFLVDVIGDSLIELRQKALLEKDKFSINI